MDSKNILNKIMTMLSIDKAVNLAGDQYGKLENGTPIATDLFEVGHQLFVLDEAGNKKKAPDGDHIIYIPTANGNKRFITAVKDGVMQSLEFNDGHNSIVDRVNFSTDANLIKNNNNMVQSTQLAQSPDETGKVTSNDEAAAAKKVGEEGAAAVSMAEGDVAPRLDALDAQLKQLRDDVAAIFSHLKGTAEDMAKHKMEKSDPDQTGKVMTEDEKDQAAYDAKKGSMAMSAKKFTGAPVEANEYAALQGLVKTKTKSTLSNVFDKMANSKF